MVLKERKNMQLKFQFSLIKRNYYLFKILFKDGKFSVSTHSYVGNESYKSTMSNDKLRK